MGNRVAARPRCARCTQGDRAVSHRPRSVRPRRIGRLATLEQATVAAATQGGLSAAYLCGLLNSELLDLWYAVRGKTPWHVRRNYEPKPMNEMPYRHIPIPGGFRASG